MSRWYTNKMRWRIPTGTLSLLFLNLSLFQYWSGSLFGTPSATIAVTYGLSPFRPLTYFTYTFIHLWPMHLFANLTFLLVLGSLVEARLGARKFIAFYFSGAVLAGLLATAIDGILSVSGSVVGASGAIFTLLGGATASRPIRALLTYSILSLLIVPNILAVQLHEEQSVVKEQAVRQVERIAAENEEIRQRYEREEISEEAYVQTAEALAEEVKTPARQVVIIKEAQRREEEISTAETIHLTGIVVGVLLMFAMCPGLSKEWQKRAVKAEKAIRRRLT